MEHIDLNKSEESTEEGIRKRVKKFTLDYSDEAGEYEDLINDDDKEIFDETFNYDKRGLAVITVWWKEPA